MKAESFDYGVKKGDYYAFLTKFSRESDVVFIPPSEGGEEEGSGGGAAAAAAAAAALIALPILGVGAIALLRGS